MVAVSRWWVAPCQHASVGGALWRCRVRVALPVAADATVGFALPLL